jgi:sarcosine oxidase subunit beta
METTEVLIVGAGVMGCSIAYHLARMGRRVCVLDRGGVAETPAASWASAGGVRRQGRDPAEAALASEEIARWPTLEQELEADLHYRQGGNLLLAENDVEAERLRSIVEKQRAMGFADVRLLERNEVHELAPSLSTQVVAGSFSPADGQADPALTTRAFAAAAQRHGAVFWLNTACEALRTQGARVVGARTARGDVAAERVVLAAGAWSDDLATALGLRLPIRTAAYQMLRSTPAAPGLLAPVLGTLGRNLSLKQLPDGALLIGGGWPGSPTPDRHGFMLRQSSIDGNWADALAILPSLGQQRLASAWCGLEAESIDGIPFVGNAPDIDGLILAVGFSGHGFAISPAIGRALADLIDGRDVLALEQLSPSRISRFSAAQIAEFAAAEPGRAAG